MWGLAETGALGNEKSKDDHAAQHTAIVTSPTRQQFAEQHQVVDVAAGYGFSAFSVQEGNGLHSLYGCGINTDGQIGIQLSRQSKQMELLIYPSRISTPRSTGIKSMDAGRAHLAVLTSCNKIWTLGNNSYGQAGRKVIANEDYVRGRDIHEFTLDGETLERVTCGQDHTMVLTKAGRVYSFGFGSDGQTGLGHYENNFRPTLIEGDIKGEKIIKLSSAGDCVLAVNEKGDLFGWGNTEYGQFNLLAGISRDQQQIHTPRHIIRAERYGRIVDIAAGGSFCLILNGNNTCTTFKHVYVQLIRHFLLVENGEVYTWGYGVLGFGPEVNHLPEPKRFPQTLFGQNDFSRDSRVSSVYAGLFHMGAITNDQDLYVWGANRFGCLGVGDKRQLMPFPSKVAVNAKVQKVAFGADHTLALCLPFA